VIPSSVVGLVIFVVLLAPGLAYVLRRERAVPTPVRSPFREAMQVVFASVACLLVVTALFALVRTLAPDVTVDFGALVRNPSRYARERHVRLAWWGLLWIALATGLGAVAADPRVARAIRVLWNSPIWRALAGAQGSRIRPVSAWYQVMTFYDNADPGPVVVGVQLDDGSYVQGRMYSFSASSDEDEDRELLLNGPLTMVAKNGKISELAHQFTVISARHIVRMDVTHLPGHAADSAGNQLAP
jgi:hypothetical protein